MSIDWSDEKQRNQLITEEVNDAERVRKEVEAMKVRLPPDVDEAVDLRAKVALQDVEKTEEGGWKIANGTAAGRVVSITDPEARHGRKSASKMMDGFKTHLIGTIASQFVTGITVTGANVPDAKPSVALIEQTEERSLKVSPPPRRDCCGTADRGVSGRRNREKECWREGDRHATMALLRQPPIPQHRHDRLPDAIEQVLCVHPGDRPVPALRGGHREERSSNAEPRRS